MSEHPHGADGHVHDEACAAAHGELTVPIDSRRLVLVFDSPVAREMAVLADRLGWPVALVDPDPARLAAETSYSQAFSSVIKAGLDIGSKMPAEIALSTVAGLLADRNGKSGRLFPRV